MRLMEHYNKWVIGRWIYYLAETAATVHKDPRIFRSTTS